ncbi:MAG: class I SAM-dependent methyltransferase [Gammaproteobacteria bacterium]|nr:class I SAM-dependent methyltransferase [Gammaproteobacteria bacterium]
MHSPRVLAASGLSPGRLANTMGFYRATVLPRLLDFSEGLAGFAAARQRTVECATGHVLEIGSGVGSSLALYSREITSLTTVDPNPVLNARVRRRLRHLAFPVDVREGRAERLPVKDAAFDCVVSTFTLGCTEQLELAAAEIYRVLKPGGRFYFVEIGLSSDPRMARWQWRLRGLQSLLAAGCKLDRPLEGALAGAGLHLKRLDALWLDGLPRVLACAYEGFAVRDP